MDTTLADIVTQNLAAAAIFDKYGLDFSCKGKKTLKVACAEKNINFEKVEKELEKLMHEKAAKNKPIHFNEIALDDLMEYIVSKHHNYVKQALPMLYTHTQKVAQMHSENHPETIEIAYYFAEIKKDLEQHLRKEEYILFPYIKNMVAAKKNINKESLSLTTLINNPIKVMENEHEKVGTLLASMKKLSKNYTLPSDACTTFQLTYSELKEFEEDLHQHMHLENNILFPKAILLEQEIRNSNLGGGSCACE